MKGLEVIFSYKNLKVVFIFLIFSEAIIILHLISEEV